MKMFQQIKQWLVNGDKKIHPSRFGDKRKGIMTSSDASKGRCLSAQEAAQSRWDEEFVARLQDKEDATTSKYCELNIPLLDGPTKVSEDEMHGIMDDIVHFEMMEDEAAC
jgi:hypothetical protein